TIPPVAPVQEYRWPSPSRLVSNAERTSSRAHGGHLSMRTKNIWREISLIAFVGIGCRGCAIHSATSGADSSDGGATGSGGSNPGGASGTGGGPSSGGFIACTGAVPPAPPGPGVTKLPCDIYADDGGPCVAAHSTVRALYASYGGPLYQLRKAD